MTLRFQIFSDGSDLNGVAHPRDIRYIRYVRCWLLFTSAWPQRAAGERTSQLAFVYSYVCFLLSALLGISYATYIWTHVGKVSFFEMGQAYIELLIQIVAATRQWLILTEKYEKCIAEFLNEVHLFHHRHVSEYAYKIHLYVHKLSHVFCIYTIGQMFWGLTLFNAIPLYNNIQAGGFHMPFPENFTYEHPIFLALPFDHEHNFNGYMVGFVMDWLITISCSIMFCTLDLLLALLMFHLWGHLKILVYDLENFPKPKSTIWYSNMELEDVTRRLKEIVIHHNLILQTSDNISATFGLSIAVYYALHQIIGCMLLLECSTLETKALIRFGPLTLILLQLQIQMSAVFELISSMTDRLIRAAYSLPWELMDVRNRRAALIILTQSQRPLGLKAVGMVEVGMQTTVTILKTTMSYFLVLVTMAKEDATP